MLKPGKNEVRIAISQLKPGMFVAKLDVAWLNNPFLKRRRLIQSEGEIHKLKTAGVRQLCIDISQGIPPEESNRKTASINKEIPTPTTTSTRVASTAANISPAPLDQERNAALKIRALVMYLAHDIYAAMEGDKQIDRKKVNELKDLTLQSLKRNEHALMNLVHVQQKSRKLTSHAFAVFGLALNFSLHLKLKADEIDHLAMAALLHEAGWIKLPINLMGKRTAYNETEKELMQQHPSVGVALLSTSMLDNNVKTIILQHHEHCDGSGYPHRVQKNDIHKLARILAICDTYDEWVHQLRDTPGMLPATAVKQLYQAGENEILDKELVHAFISMTGIYPVTSAVLLNTNEKALVREINPGELKTPVITIYYDKRGLVLTQPQVVNLAKQHVKDPHREIVKILDPENPTDDPASCLKTELE